MRPFRPRTWFGLTLLATAAFAGTAFAGMWSGGKDLHETCAAAGQPLDNGYRAKNWREPGQLFPMHNRCNAGYDLVPGWVNPGLVVFATATVAAGAGLAGTVVSVARAHRTKR